MSPPKQKWTFLVHSNKKLGMLFLLIDVAIVINAVPIGKDLLKIGVREPKVANVDDTLVYLTPTLSK